MKADFTQSYISPALNDFKEGFNGKWNFSDYNNVDTPAVFLGMYGPDDAKAFINHKGPRIMVFAGNDMHPPQLNLVSQHINDGKTFALAPPGEFSNTLTSFNIPHKKEYWAVKSYDNLTLPFDELKNKYYEKAFCYVRPNSRGGATAMHELAHMGRRTIGLGFPELEYSTEFTDIENLIELIVEESKYIGETRPDVANSVKDLFLGNEWLSLEYWK